MKVNKDRVMSIIMFVLIAMFVVGLCVMLFAPKDSIMSLVGAIGFAGGFLGLIVLTAINI